MWKGGSVMKRLAGRGRTTVWVLMHRDGGMDTAGESPAVGLLCEVM